MTNRIFGHVVGYLLGSTFKSREDLHHAKIHRPLRAGISGSGKEGADSIVLSGGYEDDEDYETLIIYTGEGGRDRNTGKQIGDQTLTRGNLTLTKNQTLGLPVRVIRGVDAGSAFAPSSGYRYDGLYMVEDSWREKGKAGFYVWRYRLIKIEEGLTNPSQTQSEGQNRSSQPTSSPQRKETNILRIVRDTNLTRFVKELYDYCCQVCGIRLETPAGPYAEAAHIQPLGKPHDSPDLIENILCLCPNHHVLFDLHSLTIADDLSLVGLEGCLYVHPDHKINLDYVRYHREHYLSF